MKHMIILRGGPGSGKSTLVKQLTSDRSGVVVCSADDFFVNAEGLYDFDPAWLGRAHGACFKKTVEAVVGRRDVVIDNTNSKPDEMLPYLALCQAFSYSCEVIKVLCDREEAWLRQTHGVPRDKFDEIHSSVVSTQVPNLYQGAPWLSLRSVGRISCNCGVSSGVRSNHESQCAAAYRHPQRNVTPQSPDGDATLPPDEDFSTMAEWNVLSELGIPKGITRSELALIVGQVTQKVVEEGANALAWRELDKWL